MNHLRLVEPELASIEALLRELATQYSSAEDENFLKDVGLFAHEMPRRLRAFLNDFKRLEPPAGNCVISGYAVNEAKIGRTPTHWKLRPAFSPTVEEEMYLLLLGSLLGDALGWSTQQDGHLIHDVIPIQGHEHEQLGSSSEELLTWHNEDAFHPYRCDYLGMMCLRNPDEVGTMLASMTGVQLDNAVTRVLFESRFTIRPDESHMEKNGSDLRKDSDEDRSSLEAAYRQINQMNSNPEKLAVLYGDPRSPYVRIDPYFMDSLDDDNEGQAALNALNAAIEGKIFDLVLQPGDCVFIDNHRTVHGRRPFKAKYDGNDRWLKRINVTRDLQKSRGSRHSCTSRIIY